MMAGDKLSLREWLLEFFFPTPRICPICRQKQPRLQLCFACQRILAEKRLNHGQCGRCGTFGLRSAVCDNCRNWPAYLRGNISVMPYEGNFRQAVVDFKFRRRPWLARALAEMMVDFVPGWGEVLVPVPLHVNRLRERGFNQSELLCRELGKLTGLPVVCDVLLRVVDTPHQTGLSRSARHDNLTGAFAVENGEKIAGKNVLLLDDVLTTGTTILQCAKVLHAAGARSVTAMTLASGQR